MAKIALFLPQNWLFARAMHPYGDIVLKAADLITGFRAESSPINIISNVINEINVA